MSDLHDAWTGLRHGGNLLSPLALDGLPEPETLPYGLADRLRSALVTLPEEGWATGDVLARLLEVVLKDACHLVVGWVPGTDLGAEYTEKLLDGTNLKPRRLWKGTGGEALAVFAAQVPRLGLGRGRRPVAHVIEYLRRRNIPLGLLTNGLQWRLLWVDADAFAWVEWDAWRWLDADRVAPELLVLRRLLSWSALVRGEAEHPPLIAGIRDTRRGQGELSRELGERVRRAVETLLRARRPVVDPAWGHHASTDLYTAACRIVMRLVVLLFAEARELLPVDSPVYHQAYGLRGLLEQLDRYTPERRRARTAAWPRLLALFHLVHGGSVHPELEVEAYGGDLFQHGDPAGDPVSRALAVLESAIDPPDDDAVHRMLTLLTRTTQRVREGAGWRTVAAPVDFTELTSEYIGILYEGLLDYELKRAGADPVVFLALGDQPALPLERLEAMDDKALAALVEKAKVKKEAVKDGEEDGEEDVENEDDEEPADDDSEPSNDTNPEEAALPDDDLVFDDARAEARTRAVAWAKRAALAGRLVAKPRGRAGAQDPVFQASLAKAAEQLVADLKLPGELYLVRWGGTRKGAGTFYTRPQLTLPTVRRTLDPLLRGPDGQVLPPERILALKVCDPAMGSGSFCVAALRILTAAVIESLHIHGRISAEGDRLAIACDDLPEADRTVAEDRLEAVIRRAVVERCLYGVDIDPLAVELARVALWVETLDRRLPFTFLDHKLRCGDSLVGAWLDRFRHYPLLAWDRQSPDEKWDGVHHPTNAWRQALSTRRAQVVAEQFTLVGPMGYAADADEALRAALDRVRDAWRALHAVPAGLPERRARIWHERVQGDSALGVVREAFDTWCALWFWPLDRLDLAPSPRHLAQLSEEARAVVRNLRDRMQFFHWELEFPDVFTAEGAGFDVVVGNPPWEIQKPNSKEFFSNHDPLFRAHGKQEAIRQRQALFLTDPGIEESWLAYVGGFKDRGNWVRNATEPFGDRTDKDGKFAVMLVPRRQDDSRRAHERWSRQRSLTHGNADPLHPFRHQGSADLNSYKMFVEAAHALLQPGGHFGLVVPSGLYTDKGTGDLRRLLLERCSWRWIYGFENRDRIFDIHRSFKFCVSIAAKGGQTETIQAAFMRHDLADWADATGTLAYPAERVRTFSPKSLSILEIRSPRDLEVLTRIYENSVLLGDDSPEGWGIQYAREFDMTNDSKLFPRREIWQDLGYCPDDDGLWRGPHGELALPVYNAKMFNLFDFSSRKHVSGKGRGAVWEDVGFPKYLGPEYLMSAEVFTGARKSPPPMRILFKDISTAVHFRTMICCLVPDLPAVNAAPILFTGSPSRDAIVQSILGSIALDYTARYKIGYLHLNYFVIEELPLPNQGRFDGYLDQQLCRWAMSLCCTHTLFSEAWIRAGRDDALSWRHLWAVTLHERLRLRCMLDAVVAALYGLDREDFVWILRDCDQPRERLAEKAFCRTLDPKGFWRVDKTQDPELRHTVLSLIAFDALQAAIAAAGDRDAGIQSFCDQHDGDGWMLPETLRLADHGLGHDDRALVPQPIAARLGPRFLDWQLAQTPEESWAECEYHARLFTGGGQVTTAVRPVPAPISRRGGDEKKEPDRQAFLFAPRPKDDKGC